MSLPIDYPLLLWSRRTLIVFAVLFSVSYSCIAQKTIRPPKTMPLDSAVRKVIEGRGYHYLFCGPIFKDCPDADLPLPGGPLDMALGQLLKGYNFETYVDGKNITISPKPGEPLFVDLRGKVVNGSGEGLVAATVSIEKGKRGTVTKDDGFFNLRVSGFLTTVNVSYTGYVTRQLTLSNKDSNLVVLELAAKDLDKAEVGAYGKATARETTGSLTVIKSLDIEKQPVTNVMEALRGEVPGLNIRRRNGGPGSAADVQLGGQHSMMQGNEPLIIVDGVPMVSSSFIGTIGSGSALGIYGASMLNGIPPSLIASITILRGAAATSIYGSRGANGVILITLKQGAADSVLHWTVDLYSGVSRAGRVSRMLTTSEFLQLREDAVTNDGGTVDDNSVPERKWGNRYTNFQKSVMRTAAGFRDANIGLSGGSPYCFFLFSANLYRLETLFPGETKDQRASFYNHINYRSINGRLRINFSGLYSRQDNLLPIADLTGNQALASNAPAFYDSNRQFVWKSDDLSIANIPALEHNTYQSGISHLLGHLEPVYQLRKGLTLEGSFGFYRIESDEESRTTLAGQNPDLQPKPTGRRDETHNRYKSGNLELLARDSLKLWKGLLETVVGVGWQGQRRDSLAIMRSGFASDLQLNSGTGATTISDSTDRVSYLYTALFGRVRYSVDRKYYLDLSARRDGSSRWGPGHQFGNFWSVGGGWIFSEAPFLTQWEWLSLGKLRANYGTTGNDQVADNQFAKVYTLSPPSRGYQGMPSVTPNTLYNPDLHWELSHSVELGLELEFFRHRLFVSTAVYRSWSGDQILKSNLGPSTGGPGVTRNLPVKVLNDGFELTIRTAGWNLGAVRWTSSFNLTIPRNKLLSFPGLAESAYATSFVEGKSLTVSKGLHYLGVDPDSGLYQFKGVGKDGRYSINDLVPSRPRDPRYYGGWGNSFSYKGFSLEIFLEFHRQNGYNPLVLLDQVNPAGMQEQATQLSNGPKEWLGYWKKKGDIVHRQRPTANPNSAAATAQTNYDGSDANVIDASYLRLKTLALSYEVPKKVLEKYKLGTLRFYIHAQDFWTYTHYPVCDPETQDPLSLPPAKTWVAGLYLNF